MFSGVTVASKDCIYTTAVHVSPVLLLHVKTVFTLQQLMFLRCYTTAVTAGCKDYTIAVYILQMLLLYLKMDSY